MSNHHDIAEFRVKRDGWRWYVYKCHFAEAAYGTEAERHYERVSSFGYWRLLHAARAMADLYAMERQGYSRGIKARDHIPDLPPNYGLYCSTPTDRPLFGQGRMQMPAGPYTVTSFGAGSGGINSVYPPAPTDDTAGNGAKRAGSCTVTPFPGRAHPNGTTGGKYGR